MNKTTLFLYWIRMGVERFKYPKCCAFEFAVDCLNKRSPSKMRGTVTDGKSIGEYVPCSKCYRESMA